MMDSFKVFDGVMEYLESVITCGEEIDYNVVARKAGCPAPLFQRIFVYVTGVNIAEYVRRRRLTLAGLAVRGGREKMIDIAMRYGFNSHAAFTRAFREHHGVSPSQMRSAGIRPVDYPRISFTNIRILGGKRIMAELKRIEYAQIDARKVVGQMKVTSFQKAGKECWGAAFESGLFDRLAELDQWICRDIDDYQGLGHMSRFTDNDHFQYIVGKFVQPDAPIPEGLYAQDVPAGKVAKIWIEADTLNEIIESAYLLCTEAIEKTGYRIDHEHFYWCDVYTYERYCTPSENGQKVTLDYILPVVEDDKHRA